MRYSAYAAEVEGYLAQMQERAKSSADREIEFPLAAEASRRWRKAAEAFESKLQQRLATEPPLPRATAAEIDARLIGVERALTQEDGLLRRPFFKHLIFAPQPTYREEVLPRVFEAIDDGRWEAIPAYEKQLSAGFDHAAKLLDEASALLDASTAGTAGTRSNVSVRGRRR